ncbi:RnfABCDGE type electron transport complex subunit D [Desulfonatronovibrio hydrogenovorans]|uniref:RnfABCDGE type electron transport complex subunit D n=1 Tax=Desulfonatronovibrio hydrogenovorans TaxID=53245 RepID=UPI00048A6E05|nr:RnfABCDGE type electron transport complex subunit D [Desulfonatronovibrio hydrogenovorans]
MNTSRMVAAASPHIHSGNSISRMMLNLIIALIPVTMVGVYLYEMQAVRLLAITITSAVAWEVLLQRLFKRRIAIADLSAVAGGLLLALLLPPTLPWWMIVVGTFMMIFLGKEIYGGLGCNPFNGVLIAWVALKISYPMAMEDWPFPDRDLFADMPALDILRYDGLFMVEEFYPLSTLFLGLDVIGPIGETSKLALLIGGIWLIVTRTIFWHLPLAMFAGVAAFSAVFWQLNPHEYPSPMFHLLAGGTFIAAFFLATDFSSSPVTKPGMVAFGIFAGILTVILRTWSQWTEGVYFAVFMASLLTPLMDKIRPAVFGKKKFFKIPTRR